MDKTFFVRKVYSGLDYASDLGGLYSAIAPVLGGIVFIINFWGSYQFIMDDLFVGPKKNIKDEEGDQISIIALNGEPPKLEPLNSAQWNPCQSLKLTLLAIFPKMHCCRCWRPPSRV